MIHLSLKALIFSLSVASLGICDGSSLLCNTLSVRELRKREQRKALKVEKYALGLYFTLLLSYILKKKQIHLLHTTFLH